MVNNNSKFERMKKYKKISKNLSIFITITFVFILGECTNSQLETTDLEPIEIDDISKTPSLPSSIVFKSIPGGTFTMGDNSINSSRKTITATEYEVTLSDFEISETEITTAQFAEFLSNAYKDGLIEIKETERATEVVGSNLSEYAGKGGQNFFYAVHDGVDISDANWNENKEKPATFHRYDVKSGSPNPYGLYNLAGNVWEWVEDNYEPYSTSPAIDPLILNGSNDRCKCGGAWNYHQATLETARRDYTFDDRGNDHHGFRVAR